MTGIVTALAPLDELEWWFAGLIDPVLKWVPLLFPFRSTIGELDTASPCCNDDELALDVLDGFGLVFPCSLKARSFLTACGLAAPEIIGRLTNSVFLGIVNTKIQIKAEILNLPI